MFRVKMFRFRRKRKLIYALLLALICTITRLFNSNISIPSNAKKSAVSLHDIKGRCKPRKNVVFVKTHKTGSSTVTNILHRHGDKNNLVFAMPRYGEHRFDWPWTMQNSSFELPTFTQFNIVCYHGRYNRSILEKLMPRDTVYVTILRHPTSQYESTFDYMRFEKILGIGNRTNPMEYFLENPMEFLVNYLLTKDFRKFGDRLKLIRNAMAFDLGFEPTFSDDKIKVEKFLRTLQKEFDLVLIAEHFEESMVLLKEFLCWPLEDFTYFNLNSRYSNGKMGEKISEKARDLMERWNKVDVKLYQHFLEIFQEKVSQRIRGKSRAFRGQVELLRDENRRLRELCVRGVEKTEKSPYGVVMQHLELNSGLGRDVLEMCDKMRWSEIDYMKYFRAKQSGFFKHALKNVKQRLVGWLKLAIRFLN